MSCDEAASRIACANTEHDALALFTLPCSSASRSSPNLLAEHKGAQKPYRDMPGSPSILQI